jgi:hypothetical protein
MRAGCYCVYVMKIAVTKGGETAAFVGVSPAFTVADAPAYPNIVSIVANGEGETLIEMVERAWREAAKVVGAPESDAPRFKG